MMKLVTSWLWLDYVWPTISPPAMTFMRLITAATWASKPAIFSIFVDLSIFYNVNMTASTLANLNFSSPIMEAELGYMEGADIVSFMLLIRVPPSAIIKDGDIANMCFDGLEINNSMVDNTLDTEGIVTL
ncbi:hypothetical protein BDC45DRAFT_532939 [Circinella umbellata]|nr:hypothetical protein BDC45DRAFT_532939 [Circinella umbellata]